LFSLAGVAASRQTDSPAVVFVDELFATGLSEILQRLQKHFQLCVVEIPFLPLQILLTDKSY